MPEQVCIVGGTGALGFGLALRLGRAQVPVVIGSRDRARAEEAAARAGERVATASFIGLDDIPMVDSSYIIIPPDVDGAVGRTKILESLNNNYRILDKATGVMDRIRAET